MWSGSDGFRPRPRDGTITTGQRAILRNLRAGAAEKQFRKATEAPAAEHDEVRPDLVRDRKQYQHRVAIAQLIGGSHSGLFERTTPVVFGTVTDCDMTVGWRVARISAALQEADRVHGEDLGLRERRESGGHLDGGPFSEPSTPTTIRSNFTGLPFTRGWAAEQTLSPFLTQNFCVVMRSHATTPRPRRSQ